MENPKSKIIYTKLSAKIEKWTGFFNILIVYLTVPAIVMPQFITSYYFYFASDLGKESFSLAYPIWYVLYSCQ